jgi:FAD synthetase
MEDRIKLYIRMVENALEQARGQLNSLNENDKKLVELAELYLQDSKYYLEKKDYATALATVSYAEGLLDSLNLTGKIKIEWKREKPRKVLVAGTFDLLHPGHIRFFEETSKLGDLYVIVARDINSERTKKRPVVVPEASRVYMVGSVRFVKKAVLGDEQDILKRVLEIKPDVIILGPDQGVDEAWLKKELAERGLPGVEVLRLSKRFNDLRPSSSREIIETVKKLFCGD